MEYQQTPPVLIKVEKKQAEDQCILNLEPYLCPFCGKTFVTQISLGAHLSDHLVWKQEQHIPE